MKKVKRTVCFDDIVLYTKTSSLDLAFYLNSYRFDNSNSLQLVLDYRASVMYHLGLVEGGMPAVLTFNGTYYKILMLTSKRKSVTVVVSLILEELNS